MLVSLSTGTWRSVPRLWIRWRNPFLIAVIYYPLSIFHILDWDEVWVWQKCFGVESKGALGKKNTFFILLILLTVWGFGQQQPIWKCQQPLVIERVANWANWEGANSDELWSVASQTFATSTPKTDLLSTEATWSTFEQSKQCEKLQLDKVPRLSISIVIWILSSDTICQLNHFFLQIVRRQCCLGGGYAKWLLMYSLAWFW